MQPQHDQVRQALRLLTDDPAPVDNFLARVYADAVRGD